jgi:MerR family redox-sensitive transcriptional activator SoxR
MPGRMLPSDQLTIGEVASRTGLATSAIRFYEEHGLVVSERNHVGHRRFRRSSIRRLSFVLIAQKLGYSLGEISAQLVALPMHEAPTDADWQRLSERFGLELDQRIVGLQLLRDKLDGCIGCGCLSLDRCELYNAQDEVAALGPGPRHLLPGKSDSRSSSSE